MNGKRLSKLLKLGALHALYREDGKWYHNLKKFPGVLFDRNGYVIFDTKEDYENNPYLIRQKDLHIINGISCLTGYKKFNQAELKKIETKTIYRAKLDSSDKAWYEFKSLAHIAQSEGRSFTSPIQKKNYSIKGVFHKGVVIGREGGEDTIIEYTFFLNRMKDINASNGAIGRTKINGHVAKISAIIYLHPQLEWADNFETILVKNQTSAEKLLKAAKSDINSFEDEHSDNFEGRQRKRLVSYYERKPHLRAKAILIHGTTCKICKFNFKENYGEHGEDYIEVHHLVPISKLFEATKINPETDMTVLCANCHRMAHRKRNNLLSIEQLIDIWNKAKSNG